MLLITHVKFHDAKHNFLLKPDCAEYHSAQSYLAYSVEWQSQSQITTQLFAACLCHA